MKEENKYDFNICIKCQKIKDLPCIENCRYLDELKSKIENHSPQCPSNKLTAETDKATEDTKSQDEELNLWRRN